MRLDHVLVVSFGVLGLLGAPRVCTAQVPLTLKEAVDTALRSRPSLKAAGARVDAAEGVQRQAGLWPNPQLEFTNENLRAGQTYGRDVDTLAVVTQPLDVLGKRGGRVDAARETVARTTEELNQARRAVAHEVALAYWAARGAQERRDLLRASAADFQQIVAYHTARFSEGALSEQDLLRVRLENEQIEVAVRLAETEAADARIALLTAIGLPPDQTVTLTEPLDREISVAARAVDEALAARSDIRVARAGVEEAEANQHLQDVLARPDLAAIYGYKRTLLPDAITGVNTAVAGIRLTIPLFDRNQGNRERAAAQLTEEQQRLRETESQARGDLARARQTYEARRQQVREVLAPLREHAASIASIARAAYEQGGVELLRLLDAERARLDAEQAWVNGMVQYQQSVVNLEFAQGQGVEP